VIQLDGLSCERDPRLRSLDLTIMPGELPAVVCPRDEERYALVQLILGSRAETSGQFLHDGQALSARARRSVTSLLPQGSMLDDDLSAIEHVEMVARIHGVDPEAALIQRVLAFSRIKNGKLKPDRLGDVARLRLTLALSVLGRSALVVALDPPAAVLNMLDEMREPDRCLLLVVRELAGTVPTATRVHSLINGQLSDGSSNLPRVERSRRYRLRVAPSQSQSGQATPQSVLSHYPGVTVNRISSDDYMLDLAPDVSGAQLIRALVQGGVYVEALQEVQGRTYSSNP
jgi:ABC-type lipoprotein export system ATPase subunit